MYERLKSEHLPDNFSLPGFARIASFWCNSPSGAIFFPCHCTYTLWII